ncbi:MAG: metalloregulator ArsR/SmtB family transcription factor [Halobacteriales archaeon]|nr:metalloregulator ArsR/SmtB family transcription factor [Halobacteriales archaeon]
MDAGALLDLLGNENRRRILRLLSRKPCYVTEISEHLGVSPKAVIDHLRRLEDAGLIESRTDDQRRKYFHIAQNVRLEVSVAPYGFGMKSNYPASPSLDLSRCPHLSIEVSEEDEHPRAVANGGTQTAEPGELASLAGALQELEEIERELSVAQRWVQGKIAGVLERLSSELEDDGYLDAEVLTAVAKGERDAAAISRELDLPQSLVEDCLERLAEHGVLTEAEDGWALVTA